MGVWVCMEYVCTVPTWGGGGIWEMDFPFLSFPLGGGLGGEFFCETFDGFDEGMD